MKWLIPTFYGDIRLEAKEKNHCVLHAWKLTATEKAAMEALFQKSRDKGWVPSSTTLQDFLTSERMTFEADIRKIERVLSKALKPGRKTIAAVKFSDGKLEEVFEAEVLAPGKTPEPEKKIAPYRESVVGTTVATPTRGCPLPEFAKAEIKARDVLMEFLDEQQASDFYKHNRFVSIGAQTGHRYLITSRHAGSRYDQQHRTLFDLDDETPFCVHDWTVPAAEEMLALHVCLQTGHEGYLRYLE